MSSPPIVTVLMPVYNGGTYLQAAIDSILNQTFKDFEFLIINDGSTDMSAEIVRSYDDSRIRLENNEMNLGLVKALNMGINLARGEYIVRMDADDISLPQRIAKQVEFMDTHLDIGICGTWLALIETGEVWAPPIEHNNIVSMLLFESNIYHPTVIMRRRLLEDNGLFYDSDFPHAEDFEFWVRSSQFIKVANIGTVLLNYRVHENKIGVTFSAKQLDSSNQVRLLQLRKLGIVPTDVEMDLHCRISVNNYDVQEDFLYRAKTWLLKILAANESLRLLPIVNLEKIIAQRWFNICMHCIDLRPSVFSHVFSEPFSRNIELRQKLLFAAIYMKNYVVK